MEKAEKIMKALENLEEFGASYQHILRHLEGRGVKDPDIILEASEWVSKLILEKRLSFEELHEIVSGISAIRESQFVGALVAMTEALPKEGDYYKDDDLDWLKEELDGLDENDSSRYSWDQDDDSDDDNGFSWGTAS